MATVSIPDLLKAAERPLALFLDDAMRSVREDYFDSVVKPFVETATRRDPGLFQEYKGEERLIDGRGQVKTSFTQCDLQFLTQFFEFAVKDQRKHTNPKVVYPDLCAFLPITRAAIITKILAIRNIRNDWAHDRKADQDQHRQMIDIAKLLDLFKEEIQHVVHEKPALFRPDTKIAVDEYVALVMTAGKDRENAGIRVVTPTRSWTKRKLIAAVVAGLAIGSLVIITVYYLTMDEPKRALALVIANSLPESKVDKYAEYLQTMTFGGETRALISFHSEKNPKGQVVEVSNETGELRRVLMKYATGEVGLTRADHYQPVFDSAFTFVQSTKNREMIPFLHVLGSVGTMDEVTEGILIRENFRWHSRVGMTEWWTSNRMSPPTFVRYGPLTRFDSLIYSAIDNKSESMRPVEWNL